MTIQTKTSKAYWENVWNHQFDTPVLSPGSKIISHEFDRAFDRAVRFAFDTWGGKAETLLEIGCGGSCYLPYFAKYHGLKVFGLDYSETGCELARKALADQHVDGEIRQGDMYEPQNDFGPFDVVFSNGLLEHFQDTAAAVSALKAFIKPGGLMISIIPNMYGMTGFLQKHLFREVYDTHVLHDLRSIASAHIAAGLEVLATRYFMTVNFGVVRGRYDYTTLGRIIPYMRTGLNLLFWSLGRLIGRSWPNRFSSPYILCVAKTK